MKVSRTLAWLLASAFALASPFGSRAQAATTTTVTPAASDISVDLGAERGAAPCAEIFVGAGTLDCDRSIPAFDGVNVGVSLQETGHGATTGGQVQVTFSTSNPGFIDPSNVGGRMDASLVYFLKVFQTAPMPAGMVVGPLPVSFHRSVFSSILGSQNGGQALASVCVGGTIESGHPCLSVDIDAGTAAQADDVNLVFEFSTADLLAGTAADEVDVDLQARCATSTSAGGSATCHTTADPVVGFDQAAFDAAQGANTFPLTDFFGIQLSEGMEFAPEPREDAMCAGALASLFLIALAEKRSRAS